VLAATASDPDGTVASYLWTQIAGPAVALTNPLTQVASFIAPVTATNIPLTFRLRVVDNRGGFATDDVVVTSFNAQPTANLGADRATRPRVPVVVTVSAFDPDGPAPAVVWSQVSGPTVTLTNPTPVSANFVAPSTATTADVVLRVTATDIDGGVGTDDIVITVTNAQPVAVAGSDRTSAAGAAVSIVGSGTDPDGTVVGFQWTQVDGPSVAVTGATSNTLSFTTPSLSTPSVITMRLTLTDNDGGTASDDVVVNVNAVPVQSGGGGGGGRFDGSALLLLLGLMLARAARQPINSLRRA
jgi:hypothetical protein